MASATEVDRAAAQVVYVSCAENGFWGLQRLVERGVRIAAVVTLPPELGARYCVSGYVDMSGWLRDKAIPMIALDDYVLRRENLQGVEFDALIVNGWNRLISAEVIGQARFGALAIHAGHPPLGLGRAPIVWNMLLGRQDIEVYVFEMLPTADDGPILARAPIEITSYEDIRHLYEKVMLVGADLLFEALGRLMNGEKGAAQALQDRSFFPKRTPEDGRIDFRQDEIALYNFVRAQRPPYPGAFAELAGERWVILKAQPFDRFFRRSLQRRPGTIIEILPSGPVVQTGGAPVWLTEVRIDGRPVFPSATIDVARDLIGLRFNSSSQHS
jgi:methionyl-tRNA formyltransferase